MIPISYHQDIEEGYNLCFTGYGKRNIKKKVNTLQTSFFSRIEKSKTNVNTPVYSASKIVKPEMVPISVKKG